MNRLLETEPVLKQFKEKCFTAEHVIRQLETFRKGMKKTVLIRPCTLGDGVVSIHENDFTYYHELHARAAGKARILKFVPASGAGSRMFKSLLVLLHRNAALAPENLESDFLKGDLLASDGRRFFENIRLFAFFEPLKDKLSANGHDIEKLLDMGSYSLILQSLLTVDGLNYAAAPKCLIPFHRYNAGSRTPLEEHLVEALEYACDHSGIARLHFTVPKEHLDNVKIHLEKALSTYLKDHKNIDISFSTQKESTDTIAVDLENSPLVDESGRLVFRPAGHGALLENLIDLEADIVFIKNIDNVQQDHHKLQTFRFKKLICGILVDLQDKVFSHLEALDAKNPGQGKIGEISSFCGNQLGHVFSTGWDKLPAEEKRSKLLTILDKPLRVCGMVRNVDEPGGGPFWVRHSDGSVSKQIVEYVQVDADSPRQREIWNSSAHFNPVDLVCGLRNFRGEQFDLRKFVDPESGIITNKSRDGCELKALEFPGLWNGSMAFWNTVFVEVSAATFSPVKTVNDLLRSEHQAL